MQRFDFFIEDGFRDADRAVRDGLRQTAACEQATGNKHRRPPADYCYHSGVPLLRENM